MKTMDTNKSEKIYVTINEAAALTGLSRLFVRQLCRSGKAPCFRVGDGRNAIYKIHYAKFCDYVEKLTECGVS